MFIGLIIDRRCCRAFLMLFFFASLNAFAHGQLPAGAETREKVPLVSLIERFEQNYELTGGDLRKLNDSYVAALKRLFDQQSKAGELDAAVSIKKEMDGFGNGEAFTYVRFAARKADLKSLQRHRETYRSARQRLEKERAALLQPLVHSYRAQLESTEAELTREGKVELALKARDVRAALDKDPRFTKDGKGAAGPGAKPFEGRLLFAGKGEYEIRLNGKRLSYRNEAERPEHYAELSSSVRTFQLGDVLTVRMRSDYVYRSFVAAIESEDGTVGVPFRRDNYRLVGEAIDIDELTRAEVLNLPASAANGSPDSAQRPAWNARELNPVTLDRAEWVQIGSGGEWFTCAVVVTGDMLVQLKRQEP